LRHLRALADSARGRQRRSDQGQLRPRRARGPHPQAGGAQARQGRDLRRLGRAEDDRRQRLVDLFRIEARDARSLARAGTLELAHGSVSTPAFVPLATRGAVKGVSSEEVRALGYELILGNTFHLLLAPGPGLVQELGGLHELMRWPRAIITDSGGFQVFSMGHGTVADEIKGRRRPRASDRGHGALLAIEEEGVRFRSYI